MKSKFYLLSMVFIFGLFFINSVCAGEKNFDVNVVVAGENETAGEGVEGNSIDGIINDVNEEGRLNTVIRNEGINPVMKGVSELANIRLDNALFFPIALVVLLILIILVYFFRKKRRKHR